MPCANPHLLRSNNRSGFKYVIFDGRAAARKAPWSISYKKYRSAGFATARAAAVHVAQMLQQHVQAVPISKRRSVVPRAPKSKTKKSVPVPIASTQPHARLQKPSAWMDRTSKRWNKGAIDLFGKRIELVHRGVLQKAVIKSWQPCSGAPFGVVFDNEPHRVYDEDLLRAGRKDWTIIPWEGDLVETADLRPMCPNCGHALDEGRDAWTACIPCGHMEPGALSSTMLSRIRSDDPYRREAIDYS